jgi:hypothetical protein
MDKQALKDALNEMEDSEVTEVLVDIPQCSLYKDIVNVRTDGNRIYLVTEDISIDFNFDVR